MSASDPTARVKALAHEIGFDDCRIAAAREASHAGRFREWLAGSNHGDMQWLARDPERRCDPRRVLPGCRSVVCVALNYFTLPPVGDAQTAPVATAPAPHHAGQAPLPRAEPGLRTPGFRIARYALNDDYHAVIEPMLAALAAALRDLGGTQWCYVDYGPVLERDFASDAGLGWNGKSTVQIHRRLGTWFFLAEVLTTLELAPDPPAGDHCGKCTRCLDACPTGAITGPHQLDARRCLSYLTIEHRGPIPEEFWRALGDRIYGCDDCLDACPWNRFARATRDARFHARETVFHHELRDFLALDDAGFRALFAGSPVLRLKRPRFLRNVCVALGNTGGAADLPALAAAAQDPDPLVAEHARWAAREINRRLHPAPGPA